MCVAVTSGLSLQLDASSRRFWGARVMAVSCLSSSLGEDKPGQQAQHDSSGWLYFQGSWSTQGDLHCHLQRGGAVRTQPALGNR